MKKQHGRPARPAHAGLEVSNYAALLLFVMFAGMFLSPLLPKLWKPTLHMIPKGALRPFVFDPKRGTVADIPGLINSIYADSSR